MKAKRLTLKQTRLAIVEQIRKGMKKQKLGNSDLAKRMKTHPSIITKILQGEQNMTLKTMFKIERALDIRILRVT